jgi:hypothetical protein
VLGDRPLQPFMKETQTRVTFGIDAHKHTQTVVIIDERGRELASKTRRPPRRLLTASFAHAA